MGTLYETTRSGANFLKRTLGEMSFLSFLRLLDARGQPAGNLVGIRGYLSDRGLSMRLGSIVDAIVELDQESGQVVRFSDAPSLTCNVHPSHSLATSGAASNWMWRARRMAA